MKKIYIIILCAILFIGACVKDGLWNQDSTVPDSQMGTIVGELVDQDTNQPLKGVKILFERQIKTDGGQTFVDTVSTDNEGNFSYKIPFPNKVRLVVRDTGRYAPDTVVVEVLEHRDYIVTMTSFPRFGLSSIAANLIDQNSQPLAGLQITLSVRESNDEEYSPVETLVTDEQGHAVFEDIAFPVYYKVELTENPVAYDPVLVEGLLSEREPMNLVLQTYTRFSIGDILLKSRHFLTNKPVKNEAFSYRYKGMTDEDFGSLTVGEFDEEGNFVLENVTYPGIIEIVSNAQSVVPFLVENTTIELTEAHTTEPYVLTIRDLQPRYASPVMTNLKVSTLLLNNNASLKAPFGVTKDKDHNLYIADGGNNRLFMVDPDGNTSVVAGTGIAGSADGVGSEATFNGLWGVAVDSSGVIYTTDAANVTGAHRIRKIVKNGEGQYTVSTLAGTGSSGGENGPAVGATFNRPSGIIYDKSRNSLYISEWSAARIRKIDLSSSTHEVSTLATTPFSFLFTMTISADYQNLYVSGNGNTGILEIDIDNSEVTTLVNTGKNNRGLFATQDNKLLATAGNQHQIFYYDLNNIGSRVDLTGTSAGDLTGAPINDVPIEEATFNQPFGIYYDAWTGNWYVANSTNNASNAIGSVRVIRSDDI